MKLFLSISIVVTSTLFVQALSITEIMSNPVGDDSGREWIEVYNNGNSPVDLSSLSISIKGGTAVPVILLQGDSNLSSGEYAIISSKQEQKIQELLPGLRIFFLLSRIN